MTGRAATATEGPIAAFAKNARETVLIDLDHYCGYDLVSIRSWVDIDGELRPTLSGLTLRIEQIDALIRGLQAARAEAIRRGLL